MKQRVYLNRRTFLRGAAVAVAGPWLVPASALGAAGRPAPSNRITMGGIGLGSQGSGDNNAFAGMADVQMIAVCDVRKNVRDRFKAQLDQRYGGNVCASIADFREMLDRTDIDAVHIAVPDHWHAYISIYAMLRGKDVYCQKPLALTIAEGRDMVRAARRFGRVFSCGSQRVWDDYNSVHRQVRSGSIGQPREGYVDNGGPSRPCDLGPSPQPIPEGMDWDMWLGPAPWAPYHPGRCDGGYATNANTWRSYREYSGGAMTDWGGHKIAAALFAMGLELTGPVAVNPADGREFRYTTLTFANGIKLYHAPNAPQDLRDVTIVGTNGTARRGGGQNVRWEFDPYHGARNIYGDFIQCVKTREKPFQDVEVAHRAATCCHLANIALWLNRALKWDPVKEQVVDDPEANKWVARAMRAPWVLPAV